MKRIKLTQGKVALVDDADFEWLNKWKWHAKKSRKTFYAAGHPSISGEKYNPKAIMHRMILDVKEGMVIDHIDGDGLNNQKHNLRVATSSQNGANRIPSKNCTSKYLGVCRIKFRNKYQANITKDSNQIYLGCFKTEKEAALAYNEAAKKIHGDFANLNIIN